MRVRRRITRSSVRPSAQCELLDRLLIINQRHTAAVMHEFERRYNDHRPHTAPWVKLLPHQHSPRQTTELHKIHRRDRFDVIIHEYQQVA